MALRIRKDGRVVCAAQYAAQDGDVYIPDDQHYAISQFVHSHSACTNRDLDWAAAYPDEDRMRAWRERYPEELKKELP